MIHRLAILAGVGMLLASGTRADGPGEVERTLDIHVTVHPGQDLEIRLVAAGLEVGQQFWVKRVVDPEQYRFSEVRIETPAGQPLPIVQKKARFVVESSPSEALVVRYRVTPGGRARHGHQGLVTESFAGFDGRAVLQPREIAAFGDVRWHFEGLPEGWSVASSLLSIDGDSFVMPPMEPRYRANVLKSLCVGLGPFREDVRKHGSSEFRVYTMAEWDDGPELADKAHSVFEFFHDDLGFEPPWPWALVWTPPGPKMAPVWSGAGATAACYERPQEGFHNWELLGHRLAHPMNEYPPLGYAITSSRDHWFMEGWATYIERVALTASGVADGTRWNRLLQRHQQETVDNPDWATFPLADEPAARGELVENLHYRRGPLAAAMLADQLKRRSGKTLEDFARHLGRTHGGFRKGLDLRTELANWSGVPLDDFWAAVVDQPGPVIPVWPEYLAALPASRPSPAVRAGSLEWTAQQLEGILKTGAFAGPGDLVQALRETARVHEELERRGVRLLPPELEGLRNAFPGRTRADLDALTRTWPLDRGPTVPSAGCSGPPAPVALPELVAVSDDGETFLALVAADRQAPTRPGGNEGLLDVRLGVDDLEPAAGRSMGVISSDEKIRVQLRWMAPRIGMRIELWQGEERVAKKWVETQSDWRRTWVRFGPDHMGERSGLFEVRMVVDGKTIASRPFWRRS